MTQRPPSILHLLFLFTFAACVAEIITPALPSLAFAFKTTKGMTQLFMTFFIVGYVFGQLIYGPIGHHYGYKLTMCVTSVLALIFSIATYLLVLWDAFILALLSRIFLAIATSSGLKMALAYTGRDFEPEKVPKITSKLMLSIALGPPVFVFLSGYLTEKLGWQGALSLAIAYNVLLCFICFTLPKEPFDGLKPFKFKESFRHFAEPFSSVRLILTGLMMGVPTAFMYFFATDAPFVTIDILGISPFEYGIFFLLPSACMFLGGIAGIYLNTRFTRIALIFWTLLATSITVGIYMFLLLTIRMSVWWIFVPASIAYFFLTITLSNAYALAIGQGSNKSYSAATASFLNLSLVFVTILILSLTDLASFLSYGTFLCAIIVLGWIIFVPLAILTYRES